MKLELCIDSLEQARAALDYPIDRLELCAALELGGLTPSYGLMHSCSRIPNIQTHVMIRHTAGPFVYGSADFDIMVKDVEQAIEAGVHGIVFGCLDAHSDVELEQCRHLVQLAKSHDLEATFHRAFDFVRDPEYALWSLIDLGFDRVLTSGQKATAEEGMALIQNMVEMADGRIEIMAGSGVNADNAPELKKSGVAALHFSARRAVSKTELNMGQVYEADRPKIENIVSSLAL